MRFAEKDCGVDLSNLGTTCVIGLFWGDEGKGKIVDVLTEYADVVVRYNGGANAGHTIVVGGERFALHLLPSGTLHDHKIGVIGPGVALDPANRSPPKMVLLALASRGIMTTRMAGSSVGGLIRGSCMGKA